MMNNHKVSGNRLAETTTAGERILRPFFCFETRSLHPIRKRAILRHSKAIKDERGSVALYAAQVNLQINAVTAKKGRFWAETR
jgi:hypothetical protein